MAEQTKGAWGRKNNIPINEKYMISVKEASDYFGIGVKQMRRLCETNTDRFAVLMGNRYLIIRHRFEEFILDTLVQGGDGQE